MSLFKILERHRPSGGRRHSDALAGVQARPAADRHDAVCVVLSINLRAKVDIFGGRHSTQRLSKTKAVDVH